MKTKLLSLLLAALLVLGLTACGSTDENPSDNPPPSNSGNTPSNDNKTDTDNDTPSEETKLPELAEFTLANGSASISLDKSWKVQDDDTGVDNMLTVGPDNGDYALVLFQIPKNSIYNLTSLDDMKSTLEESYGVSDTTPVDGFTMPGLTNVSADTGKMSAQGLSGDVCLVYGESDYAWYGIFYYADKWNDDTIPVLQGYCATFQEKAPEIQNDTDVETTDTIRWFNASYAVLTEINGWDYNMFAGLPANSETQVLEQNSLDEWWGVTDRATADETLDWILTEGHRTDYADYMAYLEEVGAADAADLTAFFNDNFEMESDEETARYVSWFENYQTYGPGSINGWDYCRALNLLSFYYLAGYYTLEEALDKSLEIAQTVQTEFDSWDDLIASYMRGYEYWAEESSAERQAIYEDLLGRDDNPYAVDFHTTLEKTW